MHYTIDAYHPIHETLRSLGVKQREQAMILALVSATMRGGENWIGMTN